MRMCRTIAGHPKSWHHTGAKVLIHIPGCTSSNMPQDNVDINLYCSPAETIKTAKENIRKKTFKTSNHHQPPSTTINHHQPPSTNINHHQPPSTNINHHQPPATTICKITRLLKVTQCPGIKPSACCFLLLLGDAPGNLLRYHVKSQGSSAELL